MKLIPFTFLIFIISIIEIYGQIDYSKDPYYDYYYKDTVARCQKHDGFFFSVNPGLFYGSTNIDYSGVEVNASNSGMKLDVNFGLRVIDNLQIHFSFIYTIAPYTLYKFPDGTGLEKQSLELGGPGLGLTYYFLDNFYAHANLNVCFHDFDLIAQGSRQGTSYQLMVGKEWWASCNWGIGVNLFYLYSRDYATSIIKTGGINYMWSHYYGLTMSFTYN